MSEKASSLLECFSECSLTYKKLVQMSEKASSLLECFSECSLYCSKKRNRPRWQMKQASLALEAYFVGT